MGLKSTFEIPDETSSVDKYVGTAYDEMKIISDNIDDLLNVSRNVDTLLIYLGAFTEPPSTRQDGTPIENGDYYFDTDDNAIVYYDAEEDYWMSVNPDEILEAQEQVFTARDETIVAKDEAKLSQDAAKVSEDNAQASADAAALSETAAAASELNASASETNAATSEANALASELDAETAATNAATSESNASDSEIAAASSANAAANSQVNAASSESAANASATAAALSETNAGNSADASAASATAANSSSVAAVRSEANAANSASQAAASELNASNSAAAASTSETNAANSASAAATSEVNAAASETEATAQADRAENFANTMANGVVFKGDWDASTGNFPTPTLSPEKADQYLISVGGTMSDGVQDDVTVVAQDFLIWNPVADVWIKNENLDRVLSVNTKAGNVVIDVADIAGLQDQIDSKANDATTVHKTSDTGKAFIPVGTSAEGGTPDKGALRFDDDLGTYVGGNGTVWGAIGGGGGVTWEPITTNTTARTGKGYMVNGEGLVVTLMPDPQQGDTVGIGDYFGKNYGVTVTSTQKIMGLDENFTFNTKNANVVFSYVDATVGYVLTQGFGESEAPQAIANVARHSNVAGQTVFSFPVTTSIYTDVFYNGVKLDRDNDYVVNSSAGTVTLTSAVKNSTDVIEIYGWNQSFVLNAADIAYDSTTSGLGSNTMQAAIDEVSQRLHVNENLFINGDFSVYQRSSFTANGFGPDRWMANSAAVANLTLTTNNGWNRMAIASTPNVNSYLTVVQRIESKNWNFGVVGEDLGIPTKVTLSGWWFRAPGMEADGAHTIIYTPTSGVQDDWSAGFRNGQRIDADLVDGWNFLTFTYDVTPEMLSLGFGVVLGFWNTDASGSTGSQTGHLANMKLEWGDVATKFVSDDPATNLNKCMRYYIKSLPIDSRWFNYAAGSTTMAVTQTFPIRMRTTPLVTVEWQLSDVAQPTKTVGSNADGLRFFETIGSGQFIDLYSYTADAEL